VLQVFVLNHIGFLQFINPYLYIYFIIALPVAFPRIPALLLAFVMGAAIDMFGNTPGIHIFACVLAAFIRPYLLEVFQSTRKFSYILIMVAVHHTALFLLEAATLLSWFVYLNIVCSIVFTMLLIAGVNLITRKETK
jgi:rod shape-determining protein MreD